MKKLLIGFICCVLLLSTLTGCFAQSEIRTVTASFYPIYILAMNVFDGIDGIELALMTAPETGCLHDYQLNARDMHKLANADAFLVCGAGMEAYLPDVQQQFPDLPVVDCSQGIDLLEEAEDEHEDEEHAYNAHTWLDAQNAAAIVHTIADAACQLFPEYTDQLRKNEAEYAERLLVLDEELKEALQPVQGKKIVTFHEAFPYFARAYGLEIAAVISEEHEETLSPSQLTAVIETVMAEGVPPLFTEPQYSASAASAVAAGTGAKIYELDPLVTGELDKDAYEAGMRANAQALLEAFGE